MGGIAIFYMAERIMLICQLSRKSLHSTYVQYTYDRCTRSDYFSRVNYEVENHIGIIGSHEHQSTIRLQIRAAFRSRVSFREGELAIVACF